MKLLQLPATKSNDHHTSSLRLWQDSSMEMDFPAQSAFQKCEQVIGIQFHSSSMTKRHCWLSFMMFLVWYWSQSLLHMPKRERSACHLLFKNFDINWIKLCIRRVLAIEILNYVYTYKVESHTDHKYLLEKDKLTLPVTCWWLQRWSLWLHSCLQARKTDTMSWPMM